MDIPFGGTVTADNFYDGTVSGAFGGVGTIVDFCLQQPGQNFRQALDTWHGKLETQKPVLDVGFHIAITDLKEHGTLADLAKLPDEGVTSYKLFMAYKGAVMVDDETLFKSMQVAADSGAVVMVHAENGDAIDVLVKEALAKGNTAPKYHALTRPPSSKARPPTVRSSWPTWRARRCTSCTSRAPTRSTRSSALARPAGTSGARPARSTS